MCIQSRNAFPFFDHCHTIGIRRLAANFGFGIDRGTIFNAPLFSEHERDNLVEFFQEFRAAICYNFNAGKDKYHSFQAHS